MTISNGKSRAKGGRNMSNDPLFRVSWYGTVAYCSWRSQQDAYELCYNLSTWTCDFNRKGYRLPTEAEWEYAARGGNYNPYLRFPGGNTISHSQANYYSYWSGAHPLYQYDISLTEGYHPAWSSDGIYPHTSPVGSFAANGYGFYDMAGNVWEWCNDRYGGYSSDPQTNPTGPTSGTYRVLRGGCWFRPTILCRVANRYSDTPDPRSYYDYGFRLVLDLN